MDTQETLCAAQEKTSLAEKTKLWWLGHHWTVRLYLGGATCMLASIALFHRSPNTLPSDVAAYASCALLITAFLGDAYAWAVPKLGQPMMKFSLTVFGATALTAATGVGRTIVNEATTQQPSLFPTTSALLSLLSVVPVITTSLTVLGAVPALVGLGWGFFKLSRSKATGSQFDVVVTLIRGFAALTLVLGASALSSSESPVYPGLRWVAAQSAFFSDLQRDDACAPLDGDRVSRINDDLVVVGRLTEDGPQFVRRTCALSAETTVLRPQVPGAALHGSAQPSQDPPHIR